MKNNFISEQPGFWGLSEYDHGCHACKCDIGGALQSTCDQSTGQCECRRHITGKMCKEVEQGYYFAHLDHNIYEAEFGKGIAVSICTFIIFLLSFTEKQVTTTTRNIFKVSVAVNYKRTVTS